MEPKFPTEWKQDDGRVLVVDLLRREELEEVAHFMDEYFLRTSPNSYLVPEYDDKGNRIRWEPQWTESFLNDSLSLTVREDSSTGRLVAARLNEIKKRTDPPPEDFSGIIGVIFKELKRDVPNLFDLYQTDNILHFAAIAVHEDYSSRGLATRLNKLSLQMAIQQGAGAAKVEAVNEYAVRSLRKLGFEVLKSIDYATLELDGSTPLACEKELLAQHPAARLMVRRLSPEDQL